MIEKCKLIRDLNGEIAVKIKYTNGNVEIIKMSLLESEKKNEISLYRERRKEKMKEVKRMLLESDIDNENNTSIQVYSKHK